MTASLSLVVTEQQLVPAALIRIVGRGQLAARGAQLDPAAQPDGQEASEAGLPTRNGRGRSSVARWSRERGFPSKFEASS